MWTVIYIAPSAKMAEKIQDKLTSEGFLAKIRQTAVSKQFEVLVPESELEEVKEVFSSILQS